MRALSSAIVEPISPYLRKSSTLALLKVYLA
jgi:hypothetical protein